MTEHNCAGHEPKSSGAGGGAIQELIIYIHFILFFVVVYTSVGPTEILAKLQV